MRRLVSPSRFCATLVVAGIVAAGVLWAASSREVGIEELKARVDTVAVGDRPKLCVQIAQRQIKEADKQYVAGDSAKGQTALADVITFSELARDYSIQTHRYEKQSEIAVRGMTRKLNDMLHTLPHDDQPAVEDAIKHLQRVRDDLLTSMFPKGRK